MKIPFTGSCQCGAVRYEVTQEPMVTVACHCQDCQKLSASAFSISMLIAPDAFHLLQGELSVFERPAEHGGTAACYFCPGCGNRVYHDNPERPGLFRLKPGGLDDTSQIEPQAHVWTSRAQPWFEFSAGIPTFETQPDLQEFLKQQAVIGQ